MNHSDLPRLSTAELVARFGDDEPALRRYRMLVALLREGRAPGEVAQTFGVSRESLRRLRRAFAETGMDAFRSRPRGGGHLNRSTPLSAVLRQEMLANPAISAAALWRRVQARLSAEGLAAPRSTVYRLLDRMRADLDSGGSGASVDLLRDALGALIEDPPLALGRSDLAALLLPEVRDPLQRGWRLQRAIRNAIERLRPAEAGPALSDPRWRHYLIVAGEYEAGEKRQALQAALVLSASTYSRAKRDALERLVALLPVALGELPPPMPPANLVDPPPLGEFDREDELELYLARLRRSGLALIWGPAGVGEFEMAVALAHRLQLRGQRVVWYASPPPEIDGPTLGPSLLVCLAAALALDQQTALWETLNTTDPDALARRFERLAEGLVGRRWTVIIANAHWLAGGEAARVIDVLTAAQEQRHIRLVLVGRDLPIWADPEQWPSLPFPRDATARRGFLHRMSDGQAPRPDGRTTLGAIRERVSDLLATVPLDLLDTLSAEQIAQFLVALQPAEALLARLRAAQAAPAADSDDRVTG